MKKAAIIIFTLAIVLSFGSAYAVLSLAAGAAGVLAVSLL